MSADCWTVTSAGQAQVSGERRPTKRLASGSGLPRRARCRAQRRQTLVVVGRAVVLAQGRRGRAVPKCAALQKKIAVGLQCLAGKTAGYFHTSLMPLDLFEGSGYLSKHKPIRLPPCASCQGSAASSAARKGENSGRGTLAIGGSANMRSRLQTVAWGCLLLAALASSRYRAGGEEPAAGGTTSCRRRIDAGGCEKAARARSARHEAATPRRERLDRSEGQTGGGRRVGLPAQRSAGDVCLPDQHQGA